MTAKKKKWMTEKKCKQSGKKRGRKLDAGKQDLIDACKEAKLCTFGSVQMLIERLERYNKSIAGDTPGKHLKSVE